MHAVILIARHALGPLDDQKVRSEKADDEPVQDEPVSQVEGFHNAKGIDGAGKVRKTRVLGCQYPRGNEGQAKHVRHHKNPHVDALPVLRRRFLGDGFLNVFSGSPEA